MRNIIDTVPAASNWDPAMLCTVQIGFSHVTNPHVIFLYVFLWLNRSFSTECYFIVWLYHSLFIHSQRDIVQAWEDRNKAAINIRV